MGEPSLSFDKEKSSKHFELYAWKIIYDQEEANLKQKVKGTLTHFPFSIEEFINKIQLANNFKE